MDGQQLDELLLVSVQEVVAPGHEPLQRRAGRVARRRVPPECRTTLEHRDDLAEPEHVHTRGGELDGQRQSVQAPRDLRGHADRLGVKLEARPRRPRPLEEELDRRGAPDLRPLLTDQQRCDRDPHLAGDAKRLAARRQDPHRRALGKQRRRDPRCLVEHVLARIEHDQDARTAKSRRHARLRIRAPHVEGVREETKRVGRLRLPARTRRPRRHPGTRAPANARPPPRAGSCPRRVAR